MICLGIDPAWSKPIAWAITDGEKVLFCGTLDPGKSLGFACVREKWDGLLEKVGLILIEQGQPKNLNSCHLMDRTGGIIEGYLRFWDTPTGQKVHYVSPSVWMSTYKLGRMRRDAAHRAALNIARYYHPELKDRDDDLASAVLISLFGARRERWTGNG
jgi:hypothetical protein